jgi:ABC-type multidrug transport system ATPase subunit
MVAGVYL